MNSDFNLKKVDFLWINREQKAFEWFLQLLSQLEMEQAEEYEGQLKGLSSNFLEIHLYMTSFSPNKDINAMALKLALDLMHIKVSMLGWAQWNLSRFEFKFDDARLSS